MLFGGRCCCWLPCGPPGFVEGGIEYTVEDVVGAPPFGFDAAEAC
jgi:hypothetical protein